VTRDFIVRNRKSGQTVTVTATRCVKDQHGDLCFYIEDYFKMVCIGSNDWDIEEGT